MDGVKIVYALISIYFFIESHGEASPLTKIVQDREWDHSGLSDRGFIDDKKPQNYGLKSTYRDLISPNKPQYGEWVDRLYRGLVSPNKPQYGEWVDRLYRGLVSPNNPQYGEWVDRLYRGLINPKNKPQNQDWNDSTTRFP